jgi:dTDP-4-dehydrorhamnose reductase
MSSFCVIGARGLVGKAFFEHLKGHDPNTVGTHYKKEGPLKKVDLKNPDLKEILQERRCSTAIIAAAIPNILRCEQEPAMTYECNVQGTLQITEQLKKEGILPVLFSTDYVFDGKQGGYDEDSTPNPLNEYGRQKAELEHHLSKEECLIVRLSKVFGLERGDKTLIDEMISAILAGKKVRAAYDQIFCPIASQDVVRVVMELVRRGARGLYHVCGNETVSRLDLAREVCQKLGASLNLVEPISLKDLSEPFLRPCRTNMKNQKALEKTRVEIGSLQAAIKLMVENGSN